MGNFAGYTGDFDWSSYTPLDSTNTNYDIFASAYKNIRFAMQPQTQYQLTATDMANLPGLAFKFYGDTSLWRGLMAYNGISDPLSGVAVGITINVPARSDIISYLSQQTNTSGATITI
jgi:hypothetical protein